jgi:two-component system nitrate/nitrite response regulator NarL
MHERGRRPTVLIADDHPLYREGLARAVSGRPDLELVAEATDGRAALEQIHQLAPDVAVLDMRMPGLRGLEVVEALTRDGSPTRVLVLSAAVESSLVYAAVAAGAAGYWSKDADRDAICDAIAAVARGERVLDPSLQSGVFSEIHAREVDTGRPVLTSREHEILLCIAQGKTAPAIGAELFLSTATIKTHLAHLYEKLGVNDRAAAVAEAMRRGLLE